MSDKEEICSSVCQLSLVGVCSLTIFWALLMVRLEFWESGLLSKVMLFTVGVSSKTTCSILPCAPRNSFGRATNKIGGYFSDKFVRKQAREEILSAHSWG